MSAILLFFSIGGGEILIILLIVLLFFGSSRIPELARGLGKGIKEIRHATDSLKEEITRSADIDDSSIKDIKDQVDKGRKAMKEADGAIKRGLKL